jgi:tetratricopeptide (TPR) repeat protein
VICFEVSGELEEEEMHLQRNALVAKLLCAVFILSFALDAFADTAPNPGEEPFTKAQAAWEKGEWERALSLCDEALKVNRRYKDAWLLKAQVFWQMKNHKMAVTSFDEYLRIDPKNAVVWVNRGANLYELGRYKDMQDSFDKALSLDPTCLPLYKTMGIDHLLMGNYGDAYRAFLKMQELGETSTYLALAGRLVQITDPSKAPPKSWGVNLSSYQTVLELTEPAKAGFLVNLTSTLGTVIRFKGSAEEPFKYAPNFEVWDGAIIFDRKGEGLLANGTQYRYKKILGDNLTVEEGKISSWRLNMSSKKSLLLVP